MFKFEYRGYTIFFTGFKPCQDNPSVIGQVVALMGEKGNNYYVNVPSSGAKLVEFRCGELFDLAPVINMLQMPEPGVNQLDWCNKACFLVVEALGMLLKKIDGIEVTS